MERRPVTRAQTRKTTQSLLPQPTKMPVASKQVKRGEDSRPKLATLDNNCKTNKPTQQLPCKATVLPVHKERKPATASQDTTATRTTLARRQPVGKVEEKDQRSKGQEKNEPKATFNRACEASSLSIPPSLRQSRLPTTACLASRHTRLAGTIVGWKHQPLKDCHSLLPDNVTDLNSLPRLGSDRELVDPQQCVEYVQDIYLSLLQAEKEDVFKIMPDLLCRQTEVDVVHRKVLIDWLVQVHIRFSLLADTLHISMDILDRYLQLVNVPKKELQLVGVTALFLASKYEEIYPNSIAEFAYITADTYTTQQIRQKERDILLKLNYQLGKPTPLTFLRRYSKLLNTTTRIHNLAKYFIEVLYLFTEGRGLLPSQCAIGALVLATRVTVDQGEMVEIWSPLMEQYTWYSHKRADIFTNHVLNSVLSYSQMCSKDSRFSSIKEKYSCEFQGVASSQRLNYLLELLAKKKLTVLV